MSLADGTGATGRSVVRDTRTRWRWLLSAGCAATLLLAACGGGGGGSGSTTPSTQATANTLGGGAGGGGSQPAPARTPLIHALAMEGSSTHVDAGPVPSNATCTISATLFFEQGAPRSVSSTRKPDSSGKVSWTLDMDPAPVGAKWDVQCTAPDSSQPGGVWEGHGTAALGQFPTSTPATPTPTPAPTPSH